MRLRIRLHKRYINDGTSKGSSDYKQNFYF